MNEEITLDSLVGEHVLTGVDLVEFRVKDEEPDAWSDDIAQRVVFTLDGVTYKASEDPSDGYRSSMRSLRVGGEVRNTFPPCRVICTLGVPPDDGYEDARESLVMTDVVTGKVVLEIGTHNSDDYYPSFVGFFDPAAMAANAA
jgi:hypothetical protein